MKQQARQAKVPISVVIPVKNEEACIEDCIRGVDAFDQVVVVDSASLDRTQEIAKRAGAEVVNYVWDGRYPKKKQWCLDNLKLKHDWVLFVDADERPSPALVSELRDVFAGDEAPPFAAYDISLDYWFLGSLLRHGHRVVKRALVHRQAVNFPALGDLEAPGMGEQEGHYQPIAHGPVGSLQGRLIHHDLDPFSTWIARHNRYSDWEAYLEKHLEVGAAVQQLRSSRGRRYRQTPLKPLVFFIYAYVLRRGFLDGRAGFHYAMAHAFYFWQISVKRNEELPPRETAQAIRLPDPCPEHITESAEARR